MVSKILAKQQLIQQLVSLTLLAGAIGGLTGCVVNTPNSVTGEAADLGIEAHRQAEVREAAAAKKRRKPSSHDTVFCYSGRSDNFQEMAAWHQAAKQNNVTAQMAIKIPPIESEHASGDGC